ncbi:hypothetical protein P153DRAFT_63321 [Dothidotthia symphoricarpi CBS 119687]|uniref:Survival motor neuron Tudor domain-containing protein n=1 Tax=Dothidotthia symphoricarpi CBS 119687 TaxID=1392245 RepID=A0A6A6A8Y3_9PLEO|nr:uncharacterized protein P153DRAFT_63321 [Dothidotthia symphoricarpi CBS 119687]KAF2127287.1 hypothetical protein P153DRAFT_63321 [Dothidotthia symphoricarpi CBS 119687]
MAPGIDMSDRNAWDDSFLQNSWNDAVTEYEKYHSIHKSGKRLEDVLSDEELKELREDHGDLIEETNTVAVEMDGDGDGDIDVDQEGTETSLQETSVVEEIGQAETQPRELRASGKQEQEQPIRTEEPALHEGGLAASMPSAILETVQDENLKNAMMSWYYAGYYTGLHAGQQKTPKENLPKQ